MKITSTWGSACARAMQAKDGKWLETAGIVLVRQKPGLAKGAMFITIEDETSVANLVICPNLYEKQRRVILSAGMMAVHGRVQREGEVVHLIAHRLTDLSSELRPLETVMRCFRCRGGAAMRQSPVADPTLVRPWAARPARYSSLIFISTGSR